MLKGHQRRFGGWRQRPSDYIALQIFEECVTKAPTVSKYDVSAGCNSQARFSRSKVARYPCSLPAETQFLHVAAKAHDVEAGGEVRAHGASPVSEIQQRIRSKIVLGTAALLLVESFGGAGEKGNPIPVRGPRALHAKVLGEVPSAKSVNETAQSRRIRRDRGRPLAHDASRGCRKHRGPWPASYYVARLRRQACTQENMKGGHPQSNQRQSPAGIFHFPEVSTRADPFSARYG